MKALTELLFRAKLNRDMQTCRVLEDYEIRLAAAAEEIQGVFDLRNSVYVKEKGWIDGQDEDELDNKSKFIIAKRNGKVVACLRLIMSESTIDPRSVEISRLCIESSHRGSQLVICLYMAAQIILSNKFGFSEAVFITKPALANSIGLVFGKIQQLAPVKELAGLRAPYRITYNPVIAPGLRKVYNALVAQLD